LIDSSFIDIIRTDALNPFSPEFEIPSWIKNNAGWWANDQIDDYCIYSKNSVFDHKWYFTGIIRINPINYAWISNLS